MAFGWLFLVSVYHKYTFDISKGQNSETPILFERAKGLFT